MLRLAHVDGQIAGEVADAVDQRVSERECQPGEHADGQQGDYRYRDPATPEPPSQGHHKRVQQQRDEASDHQQQDHAAQPVDDLPG